MLGTCPDLPTRLRPERMAAVALALHVLVAVVLGWSAAAKLTPDGRRGLVDMLGQLGVARHAGLVGGVLIAAEAGAAVLAVVPWTGSIGAAPAAVLLAVLTAGTVVVLRRRLQVRCACFGVSATVIAPIHAVRNGLLLLAAVAAVGLGFAVPAGPAAAGVAILAGAVAAVVLTRLDDVAFLLAPSGPRRRFARGLVGPAPRWTHRRTARVQPGTRTARRHAQREAGSTDTPDEPPAATTSAP